MSHLPVCRNDMSTEGKWYNIFFKLKLHFSYYIQMFMLFYYHYYYNNAYTNCVLLQIRISVQDSQFWNSP